MTDETGLDEFAPAETKPKRGKKAAADNGNGKREQGTWIARLPDNRLSAHTSKLGALREACPEGSVANIAYGTVIPDRSGNYQGASSPADAHHSLWIGREFSSGQWAAFEREIGAREFACPEGGVQFVKNGETIQL